MRCYLRLRLALNLTQATSDTAKSSCIYAFNGVCLAVSFFVFRIALNTAAVAHMIGCSVCCFSFATVTRASFSFVFIERL